MIFAQRVNVFIVRFRGKVVNPRFRRTEVLPQFVEVRSSGLARQPEVAFAKHLLG